MQQTLVEHHTHYKELHGYDKTVWKRTITAIRTVQFCPQCGKKLYMSGTINGAGFPETNIWQRDSAGRNKCLKCNNNTVSA